MAKVRNENSHYSTFTRDNNVTLVQSFVNNELREMVAQIMERDDVKLGAFVEWAIAIGVNESNKQANDDARFDVMKLHYATHRRASSRVTINTLRNENATLIEQNRAMQEKLNAMYANNNTSTMHVNAMSFSDASAS